MATHAQQNCTKFVPWHRRGEGGYIIVHGRIEFEGRTAQELGENTLVKQYSLGV